MKKKTISQIHILIIPVFSCNFRQALARVKTKITLTNRNVVNKIYNIKHNTRV